MECFVGMCAPYAGGIEQVEASIIEKVERLEVADTQLVTERDLSHITASVKGSAMLLFSIVRTCSKSVSSTKESCFAGKPGMISDLKPGPTTTSVLAGKRLASPM